MPATSRRARRCNQFKMMVRALHSAGIEVILDVVYNHTGEGNQMGPTLSMRGVDNAAYYRLSPEQRRYYMDFTGCGNTLNMQHPRVLQLIMDSLRYWVLEMHVDGFRFDLASTLARELYEVDKLGAFFDIVQQDPVLSQVKLIAEPWDVGPGGYQVGNFPGAVDRVERQVSRQRPPLLEGRRRHRQRVRHAPGRLQRPVRLGRPEALRQHQLRHLPRRLHPARPGELQRQAQRGQRRRKPRRLPTTTTAGTAAHEGPTEDPAIHELRERQKRNLLATLMLSQGVPMLYSGDELGHTQNGNNNTYCQDSELTWLDWDVKRRTGAAPRFRQAADAAMARSARAAPAKVLPGPIHSR